MLAEWLRKMPGFIFAVLVILSVFVGTSYYISNRVYHGIASFFPNVRFWPILTVFLILAVIMALGFGRSMMPLPEWLKQILGLVSACYMGIFVYLLLFTVAADLVMIVPRIMKLSFTNYQYFKGFVSAGVLVFTCVTCVYGFVNARQIDHVSYEIQLQDKVDVSDLNIVMISDLHLGAVGSEGRLQEIVDEINAQKPDLVCIAGDFFDTDYESIQNPNAAIETLKGIRSTFGTYACFGNHDAGETVSQMETFLEKAGIRLLKDEFVIIDERLVLVGRLDGSPIGSYGTQKRKELSEFLKNDNEKLPVVVLDHNPGKIHTYTNEADLILCGHTHKGQLFPASFVTNAMYTVDYGYYQKDSQSPHVIVTSGIGYWGMPMRVGTNSEIVSIKIVKE